MRSRMQDYSKWEPHATRCAMLQTAMNIFALSAAAIIILKKKILGERRLSGKSAADGSEGSKGVRNAGNFLNAYVPIVNLNWVRCDSLATGILIGHHICAGSASAFNCGPVPLIYKNLS